MWAAYPITTMAATGTGAAMVATSAAPVLVAMSRAYAESRLHQGPPDYPDCHTSGCKAPTLIQPHREPHSHGVVFSTGIKMWWFENKYEFSPLVGVYRVMKTPLLLLSLSAVSLLLLSSCVDPNYYGGSAYYGSSSYSSSYTTMPYGYTTVHVSGVPYYYYGNSWYRRSGSRYISCARPHGYSGSIGHSSRYSSYRRPGPSYTTRAHSGGSYSPSYRSIKPSTQHYRPGPSYQSGSPRHPSPSGTYRKGSRSGGPSIRSGSSGRTSFTPTHTPRIQSPQPSAPRISPENHSPRSINPPSAPRVSPSGGGSRSGGENRHPLSKPVRHR